MGKEAGKEGEGSGSGESTQQESQPKTFTQAEVDAIIGERLKREGISDLKAKAAKLEKLEQEQEQKEKSEADRLAALEDRISKSDAATTRYRVAARFKISEEDADLFLTATDEETLVKQAERLSERATPTNGKNRVPREGQNQMTPTESEERKVVRELFKVE